jgi:internalin A
LQYVKHWEGKRAELARAMREVGPENLHGIRDDLDLYDAIRATIARITDVLAGMNTLTVDEHRGTGFGELAAALQPVLDGTAVRGPRRSGRGSGRVRGATST